MAKPSILSPSPPNSCRSMAPERPASLKPTARRHCCSRRLQRAQEDALVQHRPGGQSLVVPLAQGKATPEGEAPGGFGPQLPESLSSRRRDSSEVSPLADPSQRGKAPSPGSSLQTQAY